MHSCPSADPSVHLSLRCKIENSWNLHTFLHSCSRCRSQAFTFHCAERLKTRDTCTRKCTLAPGADPRFTFHFENSWYLHTLCILALGADPSVHLSLRWKIENSWNLHTYVHSCSRCRSKRSPFTALEDWKLVKLAHVYAFLLQVQIQTFTFHCAGSLKTREPCTTYMHPCSKCRSKRSPFTALEDRKRICSWNLHTYLHSCSKCRS